MRDKDTTLPLSPLVKYQQYAHLNSTIENLKEKGDEGREKGEGETTTIWIYIKKQYVKQYSISNPVLFV